MDIKKVDFGSTVDGRKAELFILNNEQGMTVKISSYGGIVSELWFPDRQGNAGDVVLGFAKLADYLAGHPYFGALIGRYGNRIARGRFVLNDKTYTLAANNNGHHLHGGTNGFDKALWQAEEVSNAEGIGVKLDYISKDGEEGYPGELKVAVVYLLTQANELKIDYSATTDKPTPLNLTQHSYFNLAGAGKGDILGHEAMIGADAYTVVDSHLIPTGEIRNVSGSAFDFRRPKKIAAGIAQVEGGYDHNFVLKRTRPGLILAAEFYEPDSGRKMRMFTTEPAVQFYTGNFLDGTIHGKGGLSYTRHGGFCLEAQHYPDSPNHPEFPDTILKPGQRYSQQTVYQFAIKK